jgi:hypothetical protein
MADPSSAERHVTFQIPPETAMTIHISLPSSPSSPHRTKRKSQTSHAVRKRTAGLSRRPLDFGDEAVPQPSEFVAPLPQLPSDAAIEAAAPGTSFADTDSDDDPQPDTEEKEGNPWDEHEARVVKAALGVVRAREAITESEDEAYHTVKVYNKALLENPPDKEEIEEELTIANLVFADLKLRLNHDLVKARRKYLSVRLNINMSP